MAIDFGTRRIGIAVSESESLASPHSVVRNEGDIVSRLAAIAAGVAAHTIIVGIPRRTHHHPEEEKFRRLADALRQQTCKEVVLWDEALTTAEASTQLRESGRSRREAEREIDMHAAAVILQSYLDSRQRAAGRTP
ncbi:MAG: Holliday junction resolvase RuvX [Thermoanaerobaculia bacterium]